MSDVKVAVLGASGWMGRVHTMAFQTFPHFFGTDAGRAEVAALVSSAPDAGRKLGFRAPGARIYRSWQEAVEDPQIDLIDICLPDNMHYEVARAALLAGKHVLCEKPLAETAEQARELADLARAQGRIARVGHAFQCNPVHHLAKQIIDAGEIGEITQFKACQHVDVFADPLIPFMWRADGDLAPTGIVGDTGSHVFSFMDFLVGRVRELVADTYIVTPRRPVVDGLGLGEAAVLTGTEDWRDITNPDGANVLCRFENGARGMVDFSRTATGRKFHQSYEVIGTKGSVLFDYDSPNRLRLYSNDDAPGRRGYRAIDVGPENPIYAAFLPLPNFALGYNECKIIEAYETVRSITTGIPAWPDFETGHHICQITDACMASSETGGWVTL